MPLRTLDLAVRFDRPVLHNLSAHFLPARVTAILGPNGSGKSTLLRTLLGLLKPSDGAALLDDRPTHAWPRKAIAQRLAHIPQRALVAFDYRVRELVALGRYSADRANDPAQIDAALHAADLADLAQAHVAHLSEGQRQRALLARALAQLSLASPLPTTPPLPQYILADEPSSAMDLKHTFDTLALFRALASRGTGIVVVLHDIPLVMRYADDVLLLDRAGHVAGQGLVREVMRPDLLRDVFHVRFVPIDAEPELLMPLPAND